MAYGQLLQAEAGYGSLLYALEVPEDGGKTAWANLQLAYDALPDAIKAKLEGKRGAYAYNIFDVDITGDDDVKDIRENTGRDASDGPHTAGQRTERVLSRPPRPTNSKEWRQPRAGETLDELTAHVTRPEFVSAEMAPRRYRSAGQLPRPAPSRAIRPDGAPA